MTRKAPVIHRILILFAAAVLMISVWIMLGSTNPGPQASDEAQDSSAPQRAEPPSEGRLQLDHRAQPVPAIRTVSDHDPWSAASIRGRVVNGEGQPIGGATLRLREGGRSAWLKHLLPNRNEKLEHTDHHATGDGTFLITGLPQGTYLILAVSADRYLSSDGVWSGRVSIGDPFDLGDLVLAPAGTVRGLVTDEDGSPVADASVRGPYLRAQATTNTDGEFTLPSASPGPLDLIVTTSGFAPRLPSIAMEDLAPGQTIEGIHLILERGSLITGRLLSQDGAPMPDVAAKVVHNYTTTRSFGDTRESSKDEVVTENDGTFSFRRNLGAVGIAIGVPGFEAWSHLSPEIQRATDDDLGDIRLVPKHRVIFRSPVQSNGTPWVPRVFRVLAADKRRTIVSGSQSAGMVEATADGFAIFMPATEGDYVLHASDGPPSTWTYQIAEFTLSGGPKSGPFEIDLRPEAGVFGRVTDHHREPVAGARVRLHTKSDKPTHHGGAPIGWEHLGFQVDATITDQNGEYRMASRGFREDLSMVVAVDFPSHPPMWRILSDVPHRGEATSPGTTRALVEEDFAAQNPAQITVVVLDPNGDPASKTPVEIWNTQAAFFRCNLTDAQGRACFGRLPGDTYRIAARAWFDSGGGYSGNPVEIASVAETYREVDLPNGGDTTIVLRASECGLTMARGSFKILGQPVSFGLIRVYPYPEDRLYQTFHQDIRADAQGNFHTPLLPTDRSMRLLFLDEGPPETTAWLDLQPTLGAITVADLDFRPATLSVTTVDQASGAFVESTVTAYCDGHRMKRTTIRGEATFENLHPGVWEIEARSLRRKGTTQPKTKVSLRASEHRELQIRVR